LQVRGSFNNLHRKFLDFEEHEVCACILVFMFASGVIELMELVRSGGGGRCALVRTPRNRSSGSWRLDVVLPLLAGAGGNSGSCPAATVRFGTRAVLHVSAALHVIMLALLIVVARIENLG
jgi:hypothetical protein